MIEYFLKPIKEYEWECFGITKDLLKSTFHNKFYNFIKVSKNLKINQEMYSIK